MTKVGQLIKNKREQMGFSMKKLANTCGSSDSEILKIENGDRKTPNWKILCEIARALQLRPLEILLAAGYISQEDIHPSFQIHGLEKLDANEIAMVQLFIDFLTAQSQTNKSFNKNE